MTILVKIVVIVCAVFSQQIRIQTNGWRGIVPLHSTREDVESLIGPAYDESKSLYKTRLENISIRYSEGPCIGSTGWKVPVDTVLDITIYPQPYGRIRLADLDIDMDKFKKEKDSELPDTYYLINDKDGVTIYADKDQVTGEDRLTGLNYKPAARDKNLRCNR